MALKRFLQGLVIELPDGSGLGVVLDATKQGSNLYKATIVSDDGAVIIAQFKANSCNIGEDITYTDYYGFYPDELTELLTH